ATCVIGRRVRQRPTRQSGSNIVPGGIANPPQVAKVSPGSGWRNADSADYADGRRWIRVRERWVGSGGARERLLWAPCSAVFLRGRHGRHRTSRPFPRLITWGGGR